MLTSDGQVFDKYFTPDEEKQLLGCIKTRISDVYARRDYWWMVFLRHTGLRVSTLVTLTVGDAKRTVRTEQVTVTRLKKRGRAKGSDRQFYANKRVRAALSNLLMIHSQMVDHDRWDIPAEDRPLLISRNQQPITVRSLQLRMTQWCREANLPFDATPHWWRHTWAKRRLAEKNDMETLLKIQVHLDHSDLKTTSIYLQPDKESMQAFLQKVI